MSVSLRALLSSLLLAVLFAAACATAPHEPSPPLLVGPGPCTDFILRNEAGRPVEGCVGMKLIEATRSDTAGTDPVAVEGRVLVAGSLEPLPGANVRVIGEQRWTHTDADGRFRVDSLRTSDRLAISHIGFWQPDTLVVRQLPGPRRRQ